MKKWAGRVGALALCAGLLVPAVPGEALAKEESHHDFSISGFTDYAEMTKKLQQIAKSSKGLVALEVAGQSNQGRDIYTVRVGSGDKVILIQSEIHGNEKTGTEAILNVLKTVSGNSP
ncbi:murein tripeptide amidase MpaA [Bhargavaea ullalensis]|uniref:Murein tripeptide amidase MpaA n=1 Tax=Bhargavaea ullalensis TaxID=1265685 RepID=A0ABV2GE65_9BACL